MGFSFKRGSILPRSTTTPVQTPTPPVLPLLSVSPSTFALTVNEGTGGTAVRVLLASTANGVPIGAVSVGTITGTGASRITTQVTGNSITVTATEGVLAAGDYTINVPISSVGTTNSPQVVTGTLTVVAASPATTVIAASLEPLYSTPGPGLLQARPWPMRQGDCTAATIAARKPSVFVNGVEQRVYAEPLPGKYPDGSYRALWLPFFIDVPSSTPMPAEVHLDRVRQTTDISKPAVSPSTFWVTRPAESWGVDADPTLALVPTDIQYLCDADITFQPLLPASEQDAAETARLDTFFSQRLTALKAENDPLDRTVSAVRLYQATYESSLAMLASWCRTGNLNHYADALSFGYRLLEYTNNATNAAKPSPSTNVFGESRMASTDGNIAEPFSLRYLSYAACWQVSGYTPFFAAVNGQHMNQNYSGRATAAGANVINNLPTGGYINSVYLPRFNMVRMWSHLVAYAIGANRRQSTQSGFGNRDMNFPVELPLIIGALINAQYAKGDYRDGLTGCSPNGTDGIANGGTGTGAVPNFQLNYVNALYMFYEREVHADSRIPALIKANTDVIAANSKPLTVGARGYGYTDSQYGTTYWANPTTAGQPASDYLGYSMGSFAYCAARYPNTLSNGATYETWYQRAVDFKNAGYTTSTLKSDWDQFVRGMKILGESSGFQQAGPYHIRHGVPTGAPQINSLTVPTVWPLV